MSDHHAKFPTVLRGVDVVVEMRARIGATQLELDVEFTKDGVRYEPGELTREELAALCRAAARLKRD